MSTPLYIYGVPGPIGGACTKIAHLIRLLKDDFEITIIAPSKVFLKDKRVLQCIRPLSIAITTLNRLPDNLTGIALAVCDPNFFSSGALMQLRRKGLSICWSNDMMFPFPKEKEAAEEGLIDRVLFVSDFQRKEFLPIYASVDNRVTGNYIDPLDFPYLNRRNTVFTIGRLSRDDPDKYPANFPVFYEDLGLPNIKFRVMAWSSDLDKKYKWHHFDSRWTKLRNGKESTKSFLQSLDAFVYPIGHKVKESWGRAVVEAMLTGCVPVVPSGHQFDKLIRHGDTGFICSKFSEWRDAVHGLHNDYAMRIRMGKKAREYSLEKLCDEKVHRAIWIEALNL